MAAPAAVLLHAAGDPAGAGGRAGVVSRAVPPLEPDRAGAADADGGAGERAVVRRVERHGPGRSAGVARPVAAPSVGGGPQGEGPQPDAARRESQGGAPRANDVVASHARAIVRGRPAGTGEDPAAA